MTEIVKETSRNMDSDRENGLRKDKEQQRTPMTERMVEKERKDSGNQRQGDLTKERGRTTVEAKDRENGLNQAKERQ